jgi:hypothetical protein
MQPVFSVIRHVRRRTLTKHTNYLIFSPVSGRIVAWENRPNALSKVYMYYGYYFADEGL